MIAYLQGSFQAPSAATIRLTRTDTMASVDWTVSAGDTWHSADELVAEWAAAIAADGAFGGTFALVVQRDTANHRCVVYYEGPASGTITWSQAGDGTAVRDWLGAGFGATTNVTDGNPLDAFIHASYVASYGASRAHRVETARSRGHHLALSGASMTQHHGEDEDAVTLDVELWSGDEGGTNSRGALRYFEVFVDNLFDAPGGGEPFSLFTTEGDDPDTTDTTQWVLRFADSPLRIVPERVQDSRADRLWRIRFSAVPEVMPW